MQTFDELILHFLKDMYYAERMILKSLPDLAAAVQNDSLKKALVQHAEETKEQLQRNGKEGAMAHSVPMPE